MLEILVVISGAVLMSLEILGSRVLAPDYGNSIFVWGSLIGVFLAALSLGYYLGGILADRRPRLSFLATLLAAAGMFTLLIPALSPGLAARLAAWDLAGPRLGPLSASILLFFVPGVLMGTVSPYAVRLRSPATEGVGLAAGRLYALSTLGSLVGTFATAFFLIPATGVRELVHWLGVVLLGTSAAGLAYERRWVAASLVAVLLVSVAPPPGSGAGPLPAGEGQPGVTNQEALTSDGLRTVYEQDSFYHHIRVVESEDTRFLRFDNSWQSGMYLRDPFATRFEYTDFFHLATALQPGLRKALFIGLGGGSAPKAFWRLYPQLEIDVAEIDPEVVRVAREYFRLPDEPRLRVHAADGRLFLDGSRERFDLIVLDAYYADAVPFHLTTREFFRLAADHLAPGGVLAINAISALEGPRSRFYRSLVRTLQESFPTRYTFPVWLSNRDPNRPRNLILLATRTRPVVVPELVGKAAELGERLHISPLRDYAAGVWTAAVSVEGVPVLTDDHAPVDDLLKLEGLQ